MHSKIGINIYQKANGRNKEGTKNTKDAQQTIDTILKPTENNRHENFVVFQSSDTDSLRSTILKDFEMAMIKCLKI